MGLLSRIETKSPVSSETEPKKKVSERKTGLLARANKSKSISLSSFQDWAKANRFDHCGIFEIVHGMMIITHAFGMDAATIASSVSSKDFWDGTVSEFEQPVNYSKNDQDFYNFLQFFSFDLKNSIYHISFYKFVLNGNPAIFMAYNTEDDKIIELDSSIKNTIVTKKSECLLESKKEIQKNLNINSARFFSINISEYVNSSIKSIQLPEKTIYDAVTEAVYEEIYDLLKRAFAKPNLIYTENFSRFNLSLFINSEIEDDILQSHTNLLLSSILPNLPSEIALTNCGQSQDADKIIDFLKEL